MRNFVTTHPDYKKDSVVSDKITYDLTVLADDIVQGRHHGNTSYLATILTEKLRPNSTAKERRMLLRNCECFIF